MNTLIIRLSSLGDVLLTTAAVRALGEAQPAATIDVCTRPEYAEVFSHHPRVRRVVPYDAEDTASTLRELKAGEKYDCVIDLHNNIRSRMIRNAIDVKSFKVQKRTLRRWLMVRTKFNFMLHEPDVIGRYIETMAPLGVRDDGAGPEFFTGNVHLPAMISAVLNGGGYVGLCPGAKHFTKRWPEERFVELALTLAESSRRVVLFGGEFDEQICDQITSEVERRSGRTGVIFNACGLLSLTEIALAMDRCDVVVSNDSGLMHLANARRRPVVAMFGSTVRQFGFAPRQWTTIVETPISCRPCSHIGLDACPKGHFKCMQDIDVGRVVAEVLG